MISASDLRLFIRKSGICYSFFVYPLGGGQAPAFWLILSFRTTSHNDPFSA